MQRVRFNSLLVLLLATLAPCASAQEAETQPVDCPLAILPFRDRGEEVKGLGGQAADLLFAELADDAALWLVDREDLDRTLGEQELTLTGVVNPSEAVQIGRLTGARILVTGSVFQVGNSLYVIAKVMGTETTRVLGASAKGPAGDGVDALVPQLAEDVATLIKQNAAKLVAATVDKKDRVAALAESLGDAARPTVVVSVSEEHVGRQAIDPAAETELIHLCRETGFPVVDERQGSPKQADVLITGQGMSEFAGRRGNLISVKARVEVKAIDRATGKVLAVERQTRVAVDLAEQIAAKTALQEAAADLAQRLLPKIVARAAEEK